MADRDQVKVARGRGFVGTSEQLQNALHECGERYGATAYAICKTAADEIAELRRIIDENWLGHYWRSVNHHQAAEIEAVLGRV